MFISKHGKTKASRGAHGIYFHQWTLSLKNPWKQIGWTLGLHKAKKTPSARWRSASAKVRSWLICWNHHDSDRRNPGRALVVTKKTSGKPNYSGSAQSWKPLLSGWSYILFNVFVDVIVIHAKSRDCQRIWSPSLRYTSRMIQGLLYII